MNDVVWFRSSLPSEVVVLGDSKHRNVLRQTVKLNAMSVDPTFNFGPFEVTPAL